MVSISRTPHAPYYAVIFTSIQTASEKDYAETAKLMEELACEQPGYLGIDSARSTGLGITVSYWESEDAIAAWKRHVDHAVAQRRGRADWYEEYSVRVAKVERAYTFKRSSS